MSKIEKDKSTVLVINGTPYSLVRDLEPQNNHVCYKCDLAENAENLVGKCDFINLCTPETLGCEWYFVIDWDIINKHIRDYLDIDLECGRID